MEIRTKLQAPVVYDSYYLPSSLNIQSANLYSMKTWSAAITLLSTAHVLAVRLFVDKFNINFSFLEECSRLKGKRSLFTGKNSDMEACLCLVVHMLQNLVLSR